MYGKSYTRELVCQKLDLISEMEIRGIELKKQNANEYRCKPFLDDGNNNTKIRIKRSDQGYFTWNDFSKSSGDYGAGGDVVNFIAVYDFNGDQEKALEYAKEKTGILNFSPRKDTCNQTNKLIDLQNNFIDGNERLLKQSDFYKVPFEYLQSRNINYQTIKDQKISYDSYDFTLRIPFFYNDQIINYTGRFIYNEYSINNSFIDNPESEEFKQTVDYKDNLDRINKKQKYKIFRKHKRASNKLINEEYKNIPLGLNTLYKDTLKNDLILCEGTFDYLSAIQDGYKCVCTTGGAFTEDQFKHLLSGIKHYLSENKKNKASGEIILIFDNDDRGIEFSNRTINQLLEAGIFKFYVVIPEKYKDINEYYVAEKSLDGLISSKEDGLFYLARYYSGDNEENVNVYTDILERCSRFIDNQTLTRLLKKIRINYLFDEDILSNLEEAIKRKPRAIQIVDEITANYDLLYSDNGGNPRFFKFDGTIWKPDHDRLIKKNVIWKTLGRKYLTTTLERDITEMLKTEVFLEDETIFNKKRVRVFSNQGNNTLDLEPDKIKQGLRKANVNDFCTFKMDFNYNPEDECPRWIKFLNDVTGGDQDKIDMLQEYAGYVLFPKNNLHKALYMIGDGGNGKSVFFNTLIKVFGENRVSSIPIKDLFDKFMLIEIKDKDLNISSETDSKFKGSEEILKQVVADDRVTAGKKHKDNIQFKPSAKFIISANNMLEIEDKSNAIYRRFLYIKFPFKFVENPRKANEKQIDVDLPEKLEEELSGIFNWIIEGYLRLIKNGKFTESKEHLQLLKESKTMNNTVLQFVEEADLNRIDSFLYYTDFTTDTPKIFNTQFTVQEAYEQYQRFLFDLSIKPLDRNHFATQLKAIIEDRYPEYKSSLLSIKDHTGKVKRIRGYKLTNEAEVKIIQNLRDQKQNLIQQQIEISKSHQGNN